MHVKIKEHEYLVKDTTTNAVLCINNDTVIRHKHKLLELNEREQQKKEINTMKKDVADIKDILQQIIQRLN